MPIITPWLLATSSSYLLQFIAEFAFVLSFLTLWIRIYLTGYENISLETQALQLIALVLPSFNVFLIFFSVGLNAYAVLAAALTTALVAPHRPFALPWLGLVPLCVVLGGLFQYTFTTAWATAQFLAALAFVPQLHDLAGADVDKGMLAYLALVFVSRAIYLPGQLFSLLTGGFVNRISHASTLMHTCVFIVGGYMIVTRTAARRRAADPEQRGILRG